MDTQEDIVPDRIYDEARAWKAAVDNSSPRWFVDEGLFGVTSQTMNYRGKYAIGDRDVEDALIYNEMILESPADKIKSIIERDQMRRENINKMTKAQLIDLAKFYGIDALIRKSMRKVDIVDTIVSLTD